MATAALSNVLTTLDLAETTTDWNGDTFSLEPDIKVQGSNSVACVQTDNGTNDVWVDGFTPVDLSAVHLRLWFNISFVGNLAVTDPIQVYISDGTNTAYWAIDASAYAGGWMQAVVYTGNTPTSGTLPTGNSTEVGMRFTTASKPRNVPANSWFDAWYYGDGYTVTGGTSGDEIDWSHIAAVDKVEAYNIVQEFEGVYFLAGEVTIGDGTLTTYFKPISQSVQFKDLPVLSTLYQVIFYDDASLVTNIDIQGGAWSAAGTQRFTLDASVVLNSFNMTGVQVSRLDAGSFHVGAIITSTVFNDCLQVDPSTATFTGISFSNSVATDGSLLWPSDDSNISDISFAICDNDIEYASTSDATPNFFNIVHDDNAGDYDVNNTSGGPVTIPLTGTSNGNSYNPGGDTVTFQASVTITFNVEDSDGNPIQYARINIVNSTTFAELYQIETNALGIATQTHTYGGDLDIEGWVRQMDIVGDDYHPKDFKGTIKSTGFDANITLLTL